MDTLPINLVGLSLVVPIPVAIVTLNHATKQQLTYILAMKGMESHTFRVKAKSIISKTLIA